MSAYLCTDKHTSAIAHALVDLGIVTDDTADTGYLFALLRRENNFSLAHKYGDAPEAGALVEVGEELTDADRFMLAHRFEYQACEHPGYLSSAVRGWLDELRQECAVRLGFEDADACKEDLYTRDEVIGTL